MIKLKVGTVTYDDADVSAVSLTHESTATCERLSCDELTFTLKAIAPVLGFNMPIEVTSNGTLYGKYYITDIDRIGQNTYNIKAQSAVLLLDNATFSGAMYSGASATSVITAIIGSTIPYTVDNAFSSATVTGYIPPGTKRTALQQVCFVIGATVSSAFSTALKIMPKPTVLKSIDDSSIAADAQISTRDTVTAIRLAAHTYTVSTPDVTDDYVKVGGVTYIHTEQTTTVSNPDADANAPENVMCVDDVTLVNTSNAQAVLSRLSAYYFHSYEFAGTVICSGERAGDLCAVPGYDGDLITGYITQTDFALGSGMANITVSQSTRSLEVSVINSTVKCMCGDMCIRTKTYRYLQNTSYEIDLSVIRTSGAVYFPVTATLTGTTGTANETIIAEYTLAVQRNGDRLTILAADTAAQEDDIITID